MNQIQISLFTYENKKWTLSLLMNDWLKIPIRKGNNWETLIISFLENLSFDKHNEDVEKVQCY